MSNLLKASTLGKRPQIAKLAESHSSGSGFFACEALAGWADECSFVAYEVNDDGEPISGSETDWIGTKNNNTLQSLELTAGFDRDYPSGRTYLMATETAGARNKLIQGLKNTLDNDGNLKDGVVSNIKIEDGAINPEKIAQNAINNDKIADNSINGAKIVDNTIQLSKLSQFIFSKKLPRVNDLQTTPWNNTDIPGWTLDVDLAKDQKVQIDLWTSYLHAANDSSAELDFLLFADNSEIGKSFCTSPVSSIERKVTTIYQVSDTKRVTFRAAVVSGSNRRLSIYDGGISVRLIY